MKYFAMLVKIQKMKSKHVLAMHKCLRILHELLRLPFALFTNTHTYNSSSVVLSPRNGLFQSRLKSTSASKEIYGFFLASYFYPCFSNTEIVLSV